MKGNYGTFVVFLVVLCENLVETKTCGRVKHLAHQCGAQPFVKTEETALAHDCVRHWEKSELYVGNRLALTS